jgi:hypothetical protein
MFLKPKPTRSPAYLAFTRKQPCTVCRRPDEIDAHHTETGGMGTKGNDHTVLPVCWRCHRKLHDQHGKKGPWSDEERERLVTAMQNKWLEQGDKFW